MRENRDCVVPVNILTTFAHAPFSWAACLDFNAKFFYCETLIIWLFNVTLHNRSLHHVLFFTSLQSYTGIQCVQIMKYALLHGVRAEVQVLP